MARIFDTEMSMDEVMREWPATIRVILAHGMLCVGCPIAAFHTVTDAAREHGIEEAELVRDLRAVIDAEPMPEGRELSGALAFKQGCR
jgi:hybrid cluster-associated redox disulfide protein